MAASTMLEHSPISPAASSWQAVQASASLENTLDPRMDSSRGAGSCWQTSCGCHQACGPEALSQHLSCVLCSWSASGASVLRKEQHMTLG